MLQIITDAPWYVPNEVIKRDLKVLSVRQEVRNRNGTYRRRLDGHTNCLYFRDQITIVGLNGIIQQI
jgi:hypothetical protein